MRRHDTIVLVSIMTIVFPVSILCAYIIVVGCGWEEVACFYFSLLYTSFNMLLYVAGHRLKPTARGMSWAVDAHESHGGSSRRC